MSKTAEYLEGLGGRARLCKKDTEMILDMIQEIPGFWGRGQSLTRVNVYRNSYPGNSDWIGAFEWDSVQGSWQLYTQRPFIHTRQDLSMALEELAKETELTVGIEDLWLEYKTSKSEKRWLKYLGGVASFYMRLFNNGEAKSFFERILDLATEAEETGEQEGALPGAIYDFVRACRTFVYNTVGFPKGS